MDAWHVPLLLRRLTGTWVKRVESPCRARHSRWRLPPGWPGSRPGLRLRCGVRTAAGAATGEHRGALRLRAPIPWFCPFARSFVSLCLCVNSVSSHATVSSDERKEAGAEPDKYNRRGRDDLACEL